MAERSFSQLPISSSSSHGGRRMINNRRGIFPVSEYWIHAIPVIVFLCFFTLWCFSNSVSVDMSDEEIMSLHHLEQSMDMRNESHVSLAVLASSAVSPVSANQNLTAQHNATTQSHNATTQSLNETLSVKKPKQPLSGTSSVKKPLSGTLSVKKPKQPLSGTSSVKKPKKHHSGILSAKKPKQPLSG